GERLLLERELYTVENSAIDQSLDLTELFRRQGTVMGEVKPQPVRRHQRSGLMDVLTEYLTQRRVQQMRRGVIALGVAPPIARNDRLHPAQLDFPGDLAERCDSSIDLTHLIDVDTP